jgi:hypothetical protein
MSKQITYKNLKNQKLCINNTEKKTHKVVYEKNPDPRFLQVTPLNKK